RFHYRQGPGRVRSRRTRTLGQADQGTQHHHGLTPRRTPRRHLTLDGAAAPDLDAAAQASATRVAWAAVLQIFLIPLDVFARAGVQFAHAAVGGVGVAAHHCREQFAVLLDAGFRAARQHGHPPHGDPGALVDPFDQVAEYRIAGQACDAVAKAHDGVYMPFDIAVAQALLERRAEPFLELLPVFRAGVLHGQAHR